MGAASYDFCFGVPSEVIQLYSDWALGACKSYQLLKMSMSLKLQLHCSLSHV